MNVDNVEDEDVRKLGRKCRGKDEVGAALKRTMRAVAVQAVQMTYL